MQELSMKLIHKLKKKEYKLFKKMVITLSFPSGSKIFKPKESRKIIYKDIRKEDSGKRILYSLLFNNKNIGFFELIDCNDFVFIDYFYIKKTFRKIGVGSFYLTELKKIYPNIKLSILTDDKNVNLLRRFYTKNGFKKIENQININYKHFFNEEFYEF